jgi:hypothetical protein
MDLSLSIAALFDHAIPNNQTDQETRGKDRKERDKEIGERGLKGFVLA